MKTIGLIMEVNPFHNGHKYFLEQVKKKNPTATIIVLISTTVVQRGEITVLSKGIKTNLLLQHADIVVEMPLIYTNQGGQYFAYYGVKVLNDLKIDKIIFGSESGDLQLLNKYCNELTNANNKFEEGYLKSKLHNIKSNDILGISYLRAINQINQDIEVELIKRIDNNYNDTILKNNISSATAIRNNYLKYSLEEMEQYLPKEALINIKEFNQKILLQILKIKLLDIKDEKIFLSENGQLINKIRKNIIKDNIESLKELAVICSDKNNSKYKFQRLFINIILNISTEFLQDKEILDNKYKVLGFNKNAQKFLKNNVNLFFSYKEIEIEKSVYKYNEKIDKLLSIFNERNLNDINYQKPIIKGDK